jgi:hypothetical protein
MLRFFIQSFLLVQQFFSRADLRVSPCFSHGLGCFALSWDHPCGCFLKFVIHVSEELCRFAFFSLSSDAIMHGEGYLYLETAWESCGLFHVLNACWDSLAMRNCFGLYPCSFSWRKPFGPSSTLANSLGLTSSFGDFLHFVVDGSY